MGKWPRPFIIWNSAPGIFAAVRRDISGVQEKSYSPVNMITGQRRVSMRATRSRASQSWA
jgi:hypothetical protein